MDQDQHGMHLADLGVLGRPRYGWARTDWRATWTRYGLLAVCSLSSRAVRYHACGRLLVSIWVSGMHSLRYGSTLPNPNQDQLDVHRVRWPLCVPPCAPEGHSRCASGLLTGISLDTIRA